MKTNKRKGRNWIVYTAVGVVIAVLVSSVFVLNKTGVLTFSDVASVVSEIFNKDRTDISGNPDDTSSFMKAVYFDVAAELDLTKSEYSIRYQLKTKISYIKGLGFNTCVYYNVNDPNISKIINQIFSYFKGLKSTYSII